MQSASRFRVSSGVLLCVIFLCCDILAHAQDGIITTVAGNGTASLSGDRGPATSASLNSPAAVAVDKKGNLFIADAFNNRIRKVDDDGIITTVAGNGTAGFSGDGGLATSASLMFTSVLHPGSFSADVAVDKKGNLFIVDGFNNRIRKVDDDGIITTVAGNGTADFSGDGGPATSASLNFPGGVAVDHEGNIFISDVFNNVIRKVDTSGIITTFAGMPGNFGFSGDGGPATSATFGGCIQSLAVDKKGNLFIADACNSVIRKVDDEGIITTVAGNGNFGFTGDGGPATLASLDFPVGVAVNKKGNLFISDLFNNVIRKVDDDGIITTVAGNGTAGFGGDGDPATSAELNGQGGIGLDKDGDDLFIADVNNQRVRRVSRRRREFPDEEDQ